jgi:putative peptide zinc metalloprotease protein
MTLRPDVEILEGFDGVPLAFVAMEARYVRLGAGAAVVARLLDGNRTVAAISQEASVALQRRVSEQSVSAVLDHLAKVRLLMLAPDDTDAKSPEQKVPGSGTPTKLVPLLSAEKLDRVARPFALRRGSTSALPGLAVCALQLGVILAGAAVAWIVLSHTTTLFTPLALISAMPIFWAFTFVHELAHAIACIQYGIRPRSMGVALWYYFIPIAYVDRTDAYRLRSRSERVAISLAGPAADMALATLLGSLLILDVIGPNEFWGQVAVALVFFLLVSLFGNLNPLLPTDGQQAVESATGLMNVRNRSILYLTGLLRLSEGTPRPPRTRQERWAMITYGAFCLLYIVAVAALMIFSIGRLIWGLWVMFS